MKYNFHKMAIGEVKSYGYCDTDRVKIRSAILRAGLMDIDFKIVAKEGKYHIERIR